jgi:hypothetical protein
MKKFLTGGALLYALQLDTRFGRDAQHPALPLSRGGLIFTKLESAGPRGAQVLRDLDAVTATASTLRDQLLQILGNLLELMLGTPVPIVSKDAMRATGLYPGDTAPHFDIMDL